MAKALPYRRLVAALLASATIASIIGCDRGDGPGMQPTITTKEAVDRVETLIRQAVDELPEEARLEVSNRTDDFPCDAPSDGGSEDRVFVELDYWIRDLPQPYEPYFDTLQKYWTDRGYRKARIDKRSGGPWSVVYEDQKGFIIALRTTGGNEELFIRGQSPCIWPNGTPEPE